MAYLSLYRRHRPTTFSDMTGQEHITRTLSNALIRDNLAHAYLFCGPRGTGKTTAAKILARAMNCESYPTAEPCGKCIPCVNIGNGVSIDVVEMDAASNRGIDEIRDLREKTRYASSESRFRVYIIDEAHMLTAEACNAFLKTLEEPPRNVVFILATTDPSRLPSTIVSRCQRFDFHLLSVSQIFHCLDQIMKQENREAEPEAVQLIARLADGSLRDALGILEQCLAYDESIVKADHVRIVTGATRVDTISDLIEAAVTNDFESGLLTLEQIIYSGRDLDLFMRDLIFFFSRLLLKGECMSNYSSESLYGFEKPIKQFQNKISGQKLMDAVELLHGVHAELKHAHFPRHILEVAFIRLLRLLHSGLLSSTDDQPSDTKPEVEKAILTGAAEVEVVKEDEKKPALLQNERMSELNKVWPNILIEVKKRQKSSAAWLEPAVLSNCLGDLIQLTYSPEYSIHQLRIMESNHRTVVEDVLSKFCQSPVTIKAVVVENEQDVVDLSDKKKEPETTQDESCGSADALEIFEGTLVDIDREET